MKIVYMGTPDFAVPPLAALVQNGYEVTAVVTQPDKPKGRGKTLLPTPVKEEAMKHDIPVYQPLKVREPEFVETLKKLEPDMIIVAAFGQIIPKTILDMPKYGMPEYSCIASAEIQRCGTDPAGRDRRRKRIRCNDHADGGWIGYGRYDLSGSRTTCRG